MLLISDLCFLILQIVLYLSYLILIRYNCRSEILNENSGPYHEDVYWFWRGTQSTPQLLKVGQRNECLVSRIYLGYNGIL